MNTKKLSVRMSWLFLIGLAFTDIAFALPKNVTIAGNSVDAKKKAAAEVNTYMAELKESEKKSLREKFTQSGINEDPIRWTPANALTGVNIYNSYLSELSGAQAGQGKGAKEALITTIKQSINQLNRKNKQDDFRHYLELKGNKGEIADYHSDWLQTIDDTNILEKLDEKDLKEINNAIAEFNSETHEKLEEEKKEHEKTKLEHEKSLSDLNEEIEKLKQELGNPEMQAFKGSGTGSIASLLYTYVNSLFGEKSNKKLIDDTIAYINTTFNDVSNWTPQYTKYQKTKVNFNTLLNFKDSLLIRDKDKFYKEKSDVIKNLESSFKYLTGKDPNNSDSVDRISDFFKKRLNNGKDAMFSIFDDDLKKKDVTSKKLKELINKIINISNANLEKFNMDKSDLEYLTIEEFKIIGRLFGFIKGVYAQYKSQNITFGYEKVTSKDFVDVSFKEYTFKKFLKTYFINIQKLDIFNLPDLKESEKKIKEFMEAKENPTQNGAFSYLFTDVIIDSAKDPNNPIKIDELINFQNAVFESLALCCSDELLTSYQPTLEYTRSLLEYSVTGELINQYDSIKNDVQNIKSDVSEKDAKKKLLFKRLEEYFVGNQFFSLMLHHILKKNTAREWLDGKKSDDFGFKLFERNKITNFDWKKKLYINSIMEEKHNLNVILPKDIKGFIEKGGGKNALKKFIEQLDKNYLLPFENKTKDHVIFEEFKASIKVASRINSFSTYKTASDKPLYFSFPDYFIKVTNQDVGKQSQDKIILATKLISNYADSLISHKKQLTDSINVSDYYKKLKKDYDIFVGFNDNASKGTFPTLNLEQISVLPEIIRKTKYEISRDFLQTKSTEHLEIYTNNIKEIDVLGKQLGGNLTKLVIKLNKYFDDINDKLSTLVGDKSTDKIHLSKLQDIKHYFDHKILYNHSKIDVKDFMSNNLDKHKEQLISLQHLVQHFLTYPLAEDEINTATHENPIQDQLNELSTLSTTVQDTIENLFSRIQNIQLPFRVYGYNSKEEFLKAMVDSDNKSNDYSIDLTKWEIDPKTNFSISATAPNNVAVPSSGNAVPPPPPSSGNAVPPPPTGGVIPVTKKKTSGLDAANNLSKLPDFSDCYKLSKDDKVFTNFYSNWKEHYDDFVLPVCEYIVSKTIELTKEKLKDNATDIAKIIKNAPDVTLPDIKSIISASDAFVKGLNDFSEALSEQIMVNSKKGLSGSNVDLTQTDQQDIFINTLKKRIYLVAFDIINKGQVQFSNLVTDGLNNKNHDFTKVKVIGKKTLQDAVKDYLLTPYFKGKTIFEDAISSFKLLQLKSKNPNSQQASSTTTVAANIDNDLLKGLIIEDNENLKNTNPYEKTTDYEPELKFFDEETTLDNAISNIILCEDGEIKSLMSTLEASQNYVIVVDKIILESFKQIDKKHIPANVVVITGDTLNNLFQKLSEHTAQSKLMITEKEYSNFSSEIKAFEAPLVKEGYPKPLASKDSDAVKKYVEDVMKFCKDKLFNKNNTQILHISNDLTNFISLNNNLKKLKSIKTIGDNFDELKKQNLLRSDDTKGIFKELKSHNLIINGDGKTLNSPSAQNLGLVYIAQKNGIFANTLKFDNIYEIQDFLDLFAPNN